MSRFVKAVAVRVPVVREYLARVSQERELSRRQIAALEAEQEALLQRRDEALAALAAARDELAAARSELAAARSKVAALASALSELQNRPALLQYSYQDGDAVSDGILEIPISGKPDFRSVFLFAFLKSGSVVVNAIAQNVFQECGVAFLDVPGRLFEKGIDIQTFQCDLNKAFPAHGYCFGGFRQIPRALFGTRSLRRAKKVIVVRDPRDILVSLYFSVTLSHKYPDVATPQFGEALALIRRGAQLGIDDFCRVYASALNTEMLNLRFVLNDPETLVLRYEDFVYDKMRIGRALCDLCGLDLPEDRLAEIVRPYEVFPVSMQPDQHIRQVHPGDHRRRLRADTIAALDVSLSAFMDAFGYRSGSSAAGTQDADARSEARDKRA